MAARISPEAYRPRTYQLMQEYLSNAIAEHIERKKITSVDIRKTYPTIRSGHLRSLRSPDEHLQGLKLLLGIAEATGLKVELKVSS